MQSSENSNSSSAMGWGALAAAAIAAGVGIWQQSRQKKHNKELAAQQHAQNQELLREQLEYNTPKNQMARFQEAGLNPHLVYGQGNPGNQSAPLSYPEIKTTDLQNLQQIIPLFNQTRLTDSQINAQNAKTRQTYAVTELNKLQARVLEKNPLLDDAGFKATIDSLKAAAAIKGQEVKQSEIKTFVDEASANWGVLKIEKEVNLLEQRFKLGTLDGKLKAEVLKSKEFQNAILEVQKKFLTDGEVSSGQILQFIQMLLLKAM